MADDDISEEPEEPNEHSPSAKSSPKTKVSFRRLARELEDADLTNPAVGKLILGEVDALQSECARLKSIEDKFHEKDKALAIADEKLKQNLAMEIASTAMQTLGGLLAGYALYLQSNDVDSWMVWVIAAILIVTGIAFRAVKK